MKTTDPMFTARLEPALRKLAKFPQLSLAYLTRRCDLEQGDLAAWLSLYNGGSKVLADATIDKVNDGVRPTPKAPSAQRPAPSASADSGAGAELGRWTYLGYWQMA